MLQPLESCVDGARGHLAPENFVQRPQHGSAISLITKFHHRQEYRLFEGAQQLSHAIYIVDTAASPQDHQGITVTLVKARHSLSLALLVLSVSGLCAFAGMHLPDADRFGDGTPDFLRLDDEPDRQAFRRWFTFLAEEPYFAPPSRRPPEIIDCTALVRYAYREALKRHTGAWAAESNLFLVPALDSVQKYNFPHTPLGADLFRQRAGPFSPSDLTTGAFRQFADAETLQRFNTYLIGRDLRAALPGDLLFYRRAGAVPVYHTMIVLGPSQISGSAQGYVVYHTGPDDRSRGEIRRLSIPELMNYPDPQWRPQPSNPTFLGVFRWNILRDDL
jgi:uncharacterized protein